MRRSDKGRARKPVGTGQAVGMCIYRFCDLIHAANMAYDSFEPDDPAGVWFRGQASDNPLWVLRPSIYRTSLQDHERSLIQRFRARAEVRHPSCPDYGNEPRWLCLMQHYELPTRLLDWTASILVAAYFAVSHDPKPGRAMIWALDPGRLNESQGHDRDIISIYHPSVLDLLRPAFEPGDLTACESAASSEKVLGVVCADFDLRMMVQQSAYTIHGTSAPLEQLPDEDKFLMAFAIEEEAKDDITQTLQRVGIRRAILMPDLTNLSQDIKETYSLIAPAETRVLEDLNSYQQ